MNFETGSLRRTLPSSSSIRIATPQTGFDIEKTRKMASFCMGLFASMSMHALRVEPGDLPFARHQRDGAGDVMRVDVALHRVVDAGKAFLGESNRFGFDGCPGKRQAG